MNRILLENDNITLFALTKTSAAFTVSHSWDNLLDVEKYPFSFIGQVEKAQGSNFNNAINFSIV